MLSVNAVQDTGIIAVDGEVIDYTPIQVTMFQSAIDVLG
jgi:hypothetical protein